MPTGQKGQETGVLPLVKDEQSSCSACHDYDSSQGITKQIYERVGTNSDRKEQVWSTDLILTLFVINANGVKIATAVKSEIASATVSNLVGRALLQLQIWVHHSRMILVRAPWRQKRFISSYNDN
jgi:positive regulator of sigma E activity